MNRIDDWQAPFWKHWSVRYHVVMRFEVVGTHDGKPYVNWGAAILVTSVAAIFTSGGALGMYFLLTGTVSPLAAIVGFAGTVTAVGSGIRRTMNDPALHTRGDQSPGRP